MNKNAVNFAVGCDSTVRKLVELAFIEGCSQSRWFKPVPHVTTYMDLAEQAGREYAKKLFQESNAQSAQNVGRETRPSQGEAAGIRSAGPADTAQAEASRASFVECEYTGQRINGKRLICELGRGHDGHHKMQRGETAWYFLPDSCHSVTERSARRDVATGTEMAGAENGRCPRDGCPYVNGPDFSIGNPCRCTELATPPSSDQGTKR